MKPLRPNFGKRSLKWFGWTDRGKVRPQNEDTFLGLQFDAKEVHRLGRVGEAPMKIMNFAFAVSDGMGGALAGEFASQIAVEKIMTLLPRSFQHAADGLEAGAGEALTGLFSQIHRALVYVGSCYEECSGMEATLSVCWFTQHWMYFGHVGDSRIYYLPAGKDKIEQISHDDTHVGWLLRQGKINEREARSHPRRKVLQKALGGTNQFIDPQVNAVAYQVGDIFLLCTDGLVEGLHDHHLVELLRPQESVGSHTNLAHRLVEESLQKDGRDNTTALVIQVV